MKTATATKAASATSRSDRRLSSTGDDGDGDEGEEPGDVEVEPVRQHDLEPDQQRPGERGELERALPRGEERRGDGAEHEQPLEHPLYQVEVREAARVVLRPVPERER